MRLHLYQPSDMDSTTLAGCQVVVTDPGEIKVRLVLLSIRWYYLAKRGVFRLYGDEQ